MIRIRPSGCLSLFVLMVCLIYWLSSGTTKPSRFDATRWSQRLQQEYKSLSHDISISSYVPYSNKQKGSTSSDASNEEHIREKVFPDLESDPDGASSASTNQPLPVPHLIWQTSGEAIQAKDIDNINTWKKLDSFRYTSLSNAKAESLIHSDFASRHSILNLWNRIVELRETNNTRPLQTIHDNLLKYLIMYSRGGIFSAIESSCMFSPDTWIPHKFAWDEVDAIVALEQSNSHRHQKSSGKSKSSDVTENMRFVSWISVAKPRHKIFEKAIDRAHANLDFLIHHGHIETLPERDVDASTGASMFSEIVMELLQDNPMDKKEVTWSTFEKMKEPLLINGVLVLPLGSFATNAANDSPAEHTLARLDVPNFTTNQDPKPSPSAHQTQSKPWFDSSRILGQSADTTKPKPSTTSMRIITPPEFPDTKPDHDEPDMSNKHEEADMSNKHEGADEKSPEPEEPPKPKTLSDMIAETAYNAAYQNWRVNQARNPDYPSMRQKIPKEIEEEERAKASQVAAAMVQGGEVVKETETGSAETEKQALRTSSAKAGKQTSKTSSAKAGKQTSKKNPHSGRLGSRS